MVSQDNSAELPYSRGRNFATLDDYLAYLEQANGPIDLPWWRQISPGLYELQSTATNTPRQTKTRAELESQFGFAD